jgi:nitrogen fixation NifU-like protein
MKPFWSGERMTKDFEQWAKELQEMILEEDRKIFSPRVIDEYLHPQHLNKLDHPDGTATITGPCGDTMVMGLRVEGGRIVEIGFLTDGCGPTVACGSVLAQLARSRTTDEARAIDADALLRELGGLPPSHLHCARLAVDTLHEAIRNVQLSGGEHDAKR